MQEQTCCGKEKCRRAWKKEWQARKKAEDSDYLANQREAQKSWRKRNPDYSAQYRRSHPEAVEKNRLKQRERNRSRRHPSITVSPSVIAKMDSFKEEKQASMPIPSGRYRFYPLDGQIAKMDSFVVEIRAISVSSESVDVSGP